MSSAAECAALPKPILCDPILHAHSHGLTILTLANRLHACSGFQSTVGDTSPSAAHAKRTLGDCSKFNKPLGGHMHRGIHARQGRDLC